MDIKQPMQKAKLFIQQGKYLEAIEILRKIDHPTARQWIEVCRKRIPPASKKTKPARRWRFISIGALIILSAICGILFAYSRFTVGDVTLEYKWYFMCTDIAIDAVIENNIDYNDAISAAYREECQRQAESAIAIHRDEVAYCYWQTNRGRLDAQFETCLAENDAFIDGFMLGLAINNARN